MTADNMKSVRPYHFNFGLLGAFMILKIVEDIFLA